MEKKKVTIVTHNSKFHTDDIFAVATLMLVLEKDHELTVMRSRDPEVVSSADYVVDVGGEYDSARNRFDHHQTGGAGQRENTIPYASFGLVWKHFGEKICGSLEIAHTLDEILVQPLDAHDNGIQFFETKIAHVYPYVVEDFFSSLNPTWKEGMDKVDSIFMEAVGYAKKILTREITRKRDRIDAQTIVENIYHKSADKRMIMLDQYYPVDDVLNTFPEPLFVIFPKDDGTWAIKTIRDNPETFIDRKQLPKNWAGKRDEELEEVTGVIGSVFCSTGLFIAVAKTKEAILKLAEIALNS